VYYRRVETSIKEPEMSSRSALALAADRIRGEDMGVAFAFAVGIARAEMLRYREIKEAAISHDMGGEFWKETMLDRARNHRLMAHAVMLPFRVAFQRQAEAMRNALSETVVEMIPAEY
jgi:hypothetical protein